jgi:hypothetical protein
MCAQQLVGLKIQDECEKKQDRVEQISRGRCWCRCIGAPFHLQTQCARVCVRVAPRGGQLMTRGGEAVPFTAWRRVEGGVCACVQYGDICDCIFSCISVLDNWVGLWPPSQQQMFQPGTEAPPVSINSIFITK